MRSRGVLEVRAGVFFRLSERDSRALAWLFVNLASQTALIEKR